jgi:hypothetical protein
MSDRVTVFDGALPQTTDILSTNKFAMVATAYGMQAILGTNIAIDGLACLPTSPTASLNVTVGVGSLYAQDEIDATAYGDLGVDTNIIYKQAINGTVQTLAITPPTTSGFSQVYLVQAALDDNDSGAQVLSYFNASNPSVPFSGPNNAGTSNFTVRRCTCEISLVAGTPAATGTQAQPAPTAGFTGLYAITVVNGQTQITSGNIVTLTSAPFIPVKLPAVPAGVQSGVWMFGTDTSVGGNATTSASTATSSAVLNFAGGVPSFMADGLKVFDQTTPGAITGGQTVQSFTSTTVTLTGVVNATVNSGDTLVFSNDLFAATLNPIPTSLTPGMAVRIKLNSGNVGASTFNANGLGAVAIHRSGGAALSSGDLVAGMIAEIVYDGSFWQIQNFIGVTSGATSNTFNNVNLPFAQDTSTSSNTITISPTPAMPSSISAGQVVIVKLANPITGATTIGISGVSGSPFPVVSQNAQPLSFGAGNIGEMLWMLFDGSNFQIVNPPSQLLNNLTIFVNSSTGSDSLDGSQATVSGTKGPLQHIQTAVNKAFNYPPSQFSVTIQCADGTYSESVTVGPIPGPSIIINGDSGSPINVVVNGANSSNTFQVSGPNNVTIQNLKITTGTGTGPPSGFFASKGATLTTSNTVSGFCDFAVHEAFGPSTIHIGSHTYSGSSTFAMGSFFGGFILPTQGATYTISTGITVTAFATASGNGSMEVPVPGSPSFINPGFVTGSKFQAVINGVIDTQGLGVNYFPGNSAGTVTTGGVYA